jgi:hypothetical protein
MSVICYDDTKYYRIAHSMKHIASQGVTYNTIPERWAGDFDYPEDWRNMDTMDSVINNFCNDLYRANQMTYERQYQDSDNVETGFKLESLNFEKPKRVARYKSNIELYKSLQSVRYNICDNSGKKTNFNKCLNRLDSIIESIAYDIISSMPEYDKADVWSS